MSCINDEELDNLRQLCWRSGNLNASQYLIEELIKLSTNSNNIEDLVSTKHDMRRLTQNLLGEVADRLYDLKTDKEGGIDVKREK